MDSAEFILGTVTEVSQTNGIRIQLDGQNAAMSKYYKMLNTGADAPGTGDRVVVMKHSGTYVVMGKIGTPNQSSGKVDRSGDTMTGELIMADSDLSIDDPEVTLGTRPEANHWTKQLRIRDAVGNVIAKIRAVCGANGLSGVQLYGHNIVDGATVNNYLGLYMSDAGAATVEMNQPAAWRKALGLGSSTGALPLTIAQGGSGDTQTVQETTIANVATAGANVNLTQALFCRWGKLAMIEITGKATAAIASGSTLFTLVSGKRPALDSSAQVWGSTAREAVVRPSGTTILGGSTLSSGSGFIILACYLLP